MSYLDVLKRSAGTTEVPAKGSPSEFIETDIGKDNTDTEKHKEMVKMFKELPIESQIKLKREIAKRRKAGSAEHNLGVKNQEINNRNQEKMKSMYQYKMQKAKDKAFELKEKEQAKRDAAVAKNELAVMKAQKKESIKKQAARDKIVIDAEKYIRDRDLFENEIATFRAEQEKNILGPNDTEGKRIVEQAIARKIEDHKIKQKYEMEQMMNRLWNKYEDMDKIREYLREFGLENELKNLVQELNK